MATKTKLLGAAGQNALVADINEMEENGWEVRSVIPLKAGHIKDPAGRTCLVVFGRDKTKEEDDE